MGLHVVVEIEEIPDLLLQEFSVLFAIFVMTDTLFTQCPVETLDMRLFILLVCTCSAMAFAVHANLVVTLRFELWSTITLPDDESSHALCGSGDAFLPLFCRKRFPDLHIRFTRERVDGGVRKQISEIDSVTFAHVPALLGLRHFPTRVVILLPFLPEHHVFAELAVDTCETNIPSIFLA